ncbi:MAG: hypothetical protein KAR35_01860 [Candidatus Heimdallarchaeota archaeon]|nr:hypothetical protein [Candidatus Heimdallarchaeota archaeon]MCK5048098.1 hypothetical protein [Candidatus Heimdallarchaeota archaeon]
MEEEDIIFDDNEEFTNSSVYQRHSKKSRRERSNPERDEERFGHSKDSRKKTSKRKRARVRKDWK